MRRARTHAPRGLVVDLRLARGGYEHLGNRIAARLTDRAYPAYGKQARDDAGDPARFTPLEKVWVRPAGASRPP
ncbi:hypothetical protein [Nonomuraea endophytica]|uniref:hypothetical protein n=1 Tax=Nonomuraea endophytica TaxID=714136 RepID=UPI0037CBA7CA